MSFSKVHSEVCNFSKKPKKKLVFAFSFEQFFFQLNTFTVWLTSRINERKNDDCELNWKRTRRRLIFFPTLQEQSMCTEMKIGRARLPLYMYTNENWMKAPAPLFGSLTKCTALKALSLHVLIEPLADSFDDNKKKIFKICDYHVTSSACISRQQDI